MNADEIISLARVSIDQDEFPRFFYLNFKHVELPSEYGFHMGRDASACRYFPRITELDGGGKLLKNRSVLEFFYFRSKQPVLYILARNRDKRIFRMCLI